MKLNLKNSALTAALMLALAACSPDSHDMPQADLTTADLVEGKAFVITHDSANPNIVTVTSLLPEHYQVAWETPQGRALGPSYTMKIAFEGDYELRMGVSTQGGYVWSQPAQFSISTFCAEFVDHYLWRRLTGGVGQSKTWQLDLGVLEDGSAKTTYWKGPHWFWNRNYTWDYLHAANESETIYANYMDSSPWDRANAINPGVVPAHDDGSGDDWFWNADYAGNTWMCPLANYGYITFDLINGANVTITDADGNVVGKGTFVLDADNHTIAFSDVYPLSSEELSGPRTFKLLYLSDTAMQLLGDANNKSLNYVTREYFENFVPDAPAEPTLPEGWLEDISQNTSKQVRWTLSQSNPFDWFTLAGNAMNGWQSPADYPDWLGGVLDPAAYSGFDMTMDSEASTATFTMPDGSSETIAYELDTDKGIFAFEKAIPAVSVVGWVSLHADSSNCLRIVSVDTTEDGRICGIWLGAKDDVKDEYMAFHFVR